MACEVLKLYLNEGAGIDARDFASNTPLQHAAYRGKLHLVQILLDAGAKCGCTNFRTQCVRFPCDLPWRSARI